MSQFNGFNAENKLRIPLSAYAAQIIESDCLNFSKRKTTLINAIIYNYYREADCSISLQLDKYKAELSDSFSAIELRKNEEAINRLIQKKAKELKTKYAHRHNSEVNWQITLNKKVKELLTLDLNSKEEVYYGERPGHYVQSLLEEYTYLPYFKREEVVFKDIIAIIKIAIDNNYTLKVINANDTRMTIRPYKILSDPLSMYHYLIGFVITPDSIILNNAEPSKSNIISVRISRLIDVEIQYSNVGTITSSDKKRLLNELDNKGVQFISGELSHIKIWLSDKGIKQYNSRIHLRPVGTCDINDEHIYYFECTEDQILYYFISFGKDAKVLYPENLASRFKEFFTAAATIY